MLPPWLWDTTKIFDLGCAARSAPMNARRRLAAPSLAAGEFRPDQLNASMRAPLPSPARIALRHCDSLRHQGAALPLRRAIQLRPLVPWTRMAIGGDALAVPATSAH